MIKLVKVNKYFNRRKRNQMHIINNTSLELGDNGLVAILGSSGSGKTTLLNAICGLDKVNSGKIYINGKKITHKRAYTVDKIRNLNMGYIFQDYKLLENMSVYDNVALSLKMMGIKNKKEIQKRVNYVLEAVKMYRYRNRPAKMLSGGEKQRVAIARALVKNPSIVIADEPTGNLDSKNSLQVMNIIKAISKEKLVILVTHEVDLANFYASRIIELLDGKIVKDYENEPKESLEYRLDNKLYLKDFENINNIDKDDINVNIYSDNKQDKINIKLAIKDGNIYIQSENKVEVVDENSSIELVDDHYKKIDKSIYDEEKYNLENISDKKYKAKYKSIYGIVKSIITGFKRISNYTILKKLLLLGFFASSMFVVYAICSIYGALDVRDIDFMQIDRNYLQVENTTISVDDFLKYEQEPGIDYILPGSGGVIFTLNNKDNYQTASRPAMVNGYLVGIDTITADNLINGRMPENEYEIVVDKRVVQSVTSDMGMAGSLGIKTIISTIIATFVAPIIEELTFRYIIYGYAYKASNNKLCANIIQAVLFGIIHFNFILFPIYAFGGYLLGAVRDKYGIKLSSLYHILINCVALIPFTFFITNIYLQVCILIVCIMSLIYFVIKCFENINIEIKEQ